MSCMCGSCLGDPTCKTQPLRKPSKCRIQGSLARSPGNSRFRFGVRTISCVSGRGHWRANGEGPERFPPNSAMDAWNRPSPTRARTTNKHRQPKTEFWKRAGRETSEQTTRAPQMSCGGVHVPTGGGCGAVGLGNILCFSISIPPPLVYRDRFELVGAGPSLTTNRFESALALVLCPALWIRYVRNRCPYCLRKARGKNRGNTKGATTRG